MHSYETNRKTTCTEITNVIICNFIMCCKFNHLFTCTQGVRYAYTYQTMEIKNDNCRCCCRSVSLYNSIFSLVKLNSSYNFNKRIHKRLLFNAWMCRPTISTITPNADMTFFQRNHVMWTAVQDFKITFVIFIDLSRYVAFSLHVSN